MAHGLVTYEVHNLRNFAPENSRRKALLGKKWYVLSLEQMVINLIQEWGVVGTRPPQNGVWVGNRKIFSIGCTTASW